MLSALALPRVRQFAGWKKKSEMKFVGVLGSALLLLLLSAGQLFARPAAKATAAQPTEVFQGDIVAIKIPGAGLAAVEGRMGKATVPFYPSPSGAYTALVGADLDAKPGVITLTIKGTTTTGTEHNSQVTLRIKPKSFKKESFSVASEFDQLSPETLERIRNDQEEFSRAFTSSAPQRLWEGSFLLPISSEVTSPFGYRRVINGTPRAPHTGVDLKAALGTPVVAPNHGKVALVGDFFFSGLSVVLDHGGGLYTVYFHLAEYKVEMGVPVSKGDVIGLSGMTGRVTGPHLHWGARINGARVDPFELLNKLGQF
jgi:murein DD-endopeptidase MepM/ murein hydrolase activator NlpD